MDRSQNRQVILRYNSNSSENSPQRSPVTKENNNHVKTEILTLGGVLSLDAITTVFTFPTTLQQNVNWAKLLNYENIPKLIYKLRVIVGLINTSINQFIDINEVDIAKMWCTLFFKYGGIQHLLNLFLDIDFDSILPLKLSQQCITPLTYILSHFLCPLEAVDTLNLTSSTELNDCNSTSNSSLSVVEAIALPEENETDSNYGDMNGDNSIGHATSIYDESQLQLPSDIIPTTATFSATSTTEHSINLSLKDIIQGADTTGSALVNKLLDILYSCSTNAIKSTNTTNTTNSSTSSANTDNNGGGGISSSGKQKSTSTSTRRMHARYESYFKSNVGIADTPDSTSISTYSTGNSAMIVPIDDNNNYNTNEIQIHTPQHTPRQLQLQVPDEDTSNNELSLNAQNIQSTLSILVLLILHEPHLIHNLLEYKRNFIQILFYSLCISSELSLRAFVCRAIGKLCRGLHLKKMHSTTGDFISLLIPYIEQTLKYENTCAEFYYLFIQLVSIDNRVLEGININEIVYKITDIIIEKQVYEVTDDDTDYLLLGLISLLKELLTTYSIENQNQIKLSLHIEKDFLEEIFRNCLFYIPKKSERTSTSPPPKCKNANTREEALALLVELCTSCEDNFNYVLKLVSAHHNFITQVEDVYHDDKIRIGNKRSTTNITNNGYSPSSNTIGPYSSSSIRASKSKTGYCGLLNPGCICYVNSTLQQLFMIPDFRRGILSLSPQVEEEDQLEDALFQLQLTFSHLQDSDKAYYDPRPLCRTLKDIEGNPIDIAVQHDVSEFILSFFDKLETSLKNTDEKTLLKELFGGTLINELDAEGGWHSETPEDFFFLQLEVKLNLSNLHDSMEQFCKGDIVDGFTWEKTTADGKLIRDNTIATHKSAYLSTLPKHLLIHIKRYKYDNETNEQKKLNYRFEYPKILDMRPYTKDYRKRNNSSTNNTNNTNSNSNSNRDTKMRSSASSISSSTTKSNINSNNNNNNNSDNNNSTTTNNNQYLYKLSGVIVHLGSATSGHYYSYVRERVNNSWFEFNDGYVGDFDLADLDEETFGGDEKREKHFATGGSSNSISSPRYNNNENNDINGDNNDGNSSSNTTTGTTAVATYSKMKTRNAFMLVYDRIDDLSDTDINTDIDINNDYSNDYKNDFKNDYKNNNDELQQKLQHQHQQDESQDSEQVKIDLYGGKYHAIISDYFLHKVENDNNEFWRKKYILDDKYYSFMSSLLSLGVQTTSNGIQTFSPQTVQCAIKFTLGTLVSRREVLHINKWCKQLSVVLEHEQTYSMWLINQLNTPENISYLKFLMLDIDNKDIRNAVSSFIATAIRSIHNITCKYLEKFKSGNVEITSPAVLLMELFMSKPLLQAAQISWRRLTYFFTPILSFCGGGSRQRYYMIFKGHLLKLLNFFLGSDCIHPELIWDENNDNTHMNNTDKSHHIVMSDGYNFPDYRSLLCVLLVLLQSCVIRERDDVYNCSNGIEPVCSMDSKEVSVIESEVFINRLIRQIRSSSRKTVVWPIIEYIVFGSKRVSETVMDTIISLLHVEDGNEIKVPLRGAILLAQVSDIYQEWRVCKLMKRLLVEIQSSLRYVIATEVSVTMLIRLLKISPVARTWIRTNRTHLKWLESWLHLRKMGSYPQQSVMNKLSSSSSGGGGSSGRRINSSSGSGRRSGGGGGGSGGGGDYMSLVNTRVGGAMGVSALLILLRRVMSGEWYDDSYDSDDDPNTLVGRRIKVRWSEGAMYAGSIVAYSDSTETHEVLYDDGDRKTYRMSDKTWELLDPAADPATTASQNSPVSNVNARGGRRG